MAATNVWIGYASSMERNPYDESLSLRDLIKTVDLLELFVSMSETPTSSFTETTVDEYQELMTWRDEARTFSTGDYSDADIRRVIQIGEAALMVLDDYCWYIVQDAMKIHPRLKRWLFAQTA